MTPTSRPRRTFALTVCMSAAVAVVAPLAGELAASRHESAPPPPQRAPVPAPSWGVAHVPVFLPSELVEEPAQETSQLSLRDNPTTSAEDQATTLREGELERLDAFRRVAALTDTQWQTMLRALADTAQMDREATDDTAATPPGARAEIRFELGRELHRRLERALTHSQMAEFRFRFSAFDLIGAARAFDLVAASGPPS